MSGRRFLIPLLLAALVLPIVICVLLGVGGLLEAMSDIDGALAVRRVSLALGILWVVDLVLLIIAQAVASLLRP